MLFARNLGRDGEAPRLAVRLAAADIDMLTIVIVSGSASRIIAGSEPRLYTPRGYGET